MEIEDVKRMLLQEMKEWYKDNSNGEEAERYVVCAGLAVVEKMYENYPLSKEDYLTKGNQLKTSYSLINNQILRGRYGIDKVYSKEGGRTTRSTAQAGDQIAVRLNNMREVISPLTKEERHQVCESMQDWLVDKVRLYFDAQRLEIDFNAEASLSTNITSILAVASHRGITGHVAQHLVGAKLSLRFPELDIPMHSVTTADDQLGRFGDFLVNHYVFHVTVAPSGAVIKKCAENIRNGHRPILIVPDNKVQAARQLAEIDSISEKVTIYSIENFIAQNIEEIGFFSRETVNTTFGNLLKKYNEIIETYEGIPSYKIEIPYFLR